MLGLSLIHIWVAVSCDLAKAVSDADVVMLLRIQHERQSSAHFPSSSEYANIFGLDRRRAHLLKPGAIIMHPGPINRGVELDSFLADSGRSVILNQVTNGVAVRMAVMKLCMGATLGRLAKRTGLKSETRGLLTRHKIWTASATCS